MLRTPSRSNTPDYEYLRNLTEEEDASISEVSTQVAPEESEITSTALVEFDEAAQNMLAHNRAALGRRLENTVYESIFRPAVPAVIDVDEDACSVSSMSSAGNS